MKSINVLYLLCATIVIAGCSFGAKQAAAWQQAALEQKLAGEMVSIPAGTFRMGDLRGKGEGDEQPVHSVSVPAFKLGKYEVTFAQWNACAEDGGCIELPSEEPMELPFSITTTYDDGTHSEPVSEVGGCMSAACSCEGYDMESRDWTPCANYPVVGVSWDDVQSFIDWLNNKTGGNYRLPTEAEWEYAARAGTTTVYSWGNDIGSNRANCNNNYCVDSWEYTAPVGSFPANAWGLHDMHGNVREWVQDCWHYDGYEGAPTDGSAWITGTTSRYDCSWRVVRGGGQSNHPWRLRAAWRDETPRSARYFHYGFRLAQDELLMEVGADGSIHEPHGKARAAVYKKEARRKEIGARMSEPIRADEMVSIPAGNFRMGDLSGESYDDNDKPVRNVTVPAFKLGKYEVTYAQWYACVADGGCDGYTPDDEGWGRGNLPVEAVSWDEVQSFIDWLNEKTGGNYRLPTEAEWEYAARAGTTTEYSWGNYLGSVRANCEIRNCGDSWDYTAPVGTFPANPWGLHDMHGNVSEWVQDCYNDSYEGAPTGGSAWTSGDCGRRVVRGGSWDDYGSDLRSARRYGPNRWYRDDDLGFRLAQDG